MTGEKETVERSDFVKWLTEYWCELLAGFAGLIGVFFFVACPHRSYFLLFVAGVIGGLVGAGSAWLYAKGAKQDETDIRLRTGVWFVGLFLLVGGVAAYVNVSLDTSQRQAAPAVFVRLESSSSSPSRQIEYIRVREDSGAEWVAPARLKDIKDLKSGDPVLVEKRTGLFGVAYAVGVRPAPRQPTEEEKKDRPRVRIVTNLGEIVVELYPDKAPVTVRNFLRYVKEKAYDDTIFHRVVKDFVVQGGGFDRDMKPIKTHSPIVNEANNGLKNLRGTIAMARTSDPDSATSQFYINVKDNAALDHRDSSQMGMGYCVFGKVVKGLDVVDRISRVRTRAFKGHQNVPVDPVVIESIRVIGEK